MQTQRFTLLEALNEVADRMQLRQISSTTAGGAWARTMISNLNEVMADIFDYGPWDEAETSATFTMVCGLSTYSVATTASNSANFVQIHSIQEVALSGRVPPLEPISSVNEMRLLNRVGSIGTPSRFGVHGVDGSDNPVITIFPRPSTTWDGVVGRVSYYALPPRYEVGDDAVRLNAPSRLIVAGLHAAAVLDESGGAETQQWKTLKGIYEVMKRSMHTRRRRKTGEQTRFQPGMTQRS